MSGSAVHQDPEDGRLASLLRSQFFLVDVTATGPGRWTVGVDAEELGIAEDVASAARAIAGKTPIKLVDNEYRLAFNRHVGQMRSAVERLGVRCEESCFVPRGSLDEVLSCVASVARGWQSWLACHDLPGMVEGVQEEVGRLAGALARVAEEQALRGSVVGWEDWQSWRGRLGIPPDTPADAAAALMPGIAGTVAAREGVAAGDECLTRWEKTRRWLGERGLADLTGPDSTLVEDRARPHARQRGADASAQFLSRVSGRIPDEASLRQASVREKVRRVPFLQDVSDLDDIAAAAIRRSEARGLEHFKHDLPRVLSERLADVLSSVLSRPSPAQLTGKTRAWVQRTAEWVREFNVTGDSFIDRCVDSVAALEGPQPPSTARLTLLLRSCTAVTELREPAATAVTRAEPSQPGPPRGVSRGRAAAAALERRADHPVELQLELQ